MVKHIFYKGDIFRSGCDTLAVLVKEKKYELIENIDKKFDNIFKHSVEIGDFKGETGEVILFYVNINGIKRYVVASMGDEGLEGLRIAVANIVSKVKDYSERLLIYIPDIGIDYSYAIEQSVISVEMTLYDPGNRYKAKEKKEVKLKEVYYSVMDSGDYSKEIEKGIILAEAVNYARDIANAPSSEMDPDRVEEEAKKLAKELGLKIKVLHRKELEKQGLNGIIAVGRGGSSEPRLIILEYKGSNRDSWDIAVIGKTVTFDAGGLDIKTAEGMYNMKFDKSGGAAALGIIRAAAKLKLPVNLVIALPAVENMPGPNSYRPRDVIRMYNGLTVEVGNTDAEGRITLADALAYIEKNYRPKEIIDLATLTGAIVVALGNHAIGLFSNNDELARELTEVGEIVGERLWRMPLWKEYYEQLKSEVADINNVGGRPGGAITAAAFLSKFIENTAWAHLDIAGTAWVQQHGPKKPYYPKGATGVGVRLITYYIMRKYGLQK